MDWQSKWLFITYQTDIEPREPGPCASLSPYSMPCNPHTYTASHLASFVIKLEHHKGLWKTEYTQHPAILCMEALQEASN